MEVKMILLSFIPLCFLFVAPLAKTSMIELKSEWRPNFGWEVICSWTLYANDTLQSVRLYKNYQHFMVYRPERDGSKRSLQSTLTNAEFHVDCYEKNVLTGQCVMSLEILQPITEDLVYACEVSGERPFFRIESKRIDIEALVAPSDAVVEKINQDQESSGRVNVNCTSSGIPAPNLLWTIGDQKIPQDFSGNAWNFTSKLFDVWSTLSYTPVDSNSHAICTPETVKGQQLVKGHPAQYNAAGVVTGTTAVIASISLIVALMR